MNFKAKLLRYFEMGWPALTQLKSWMKRSASFNGFDASNFSNPSLRVAEAKNEQGETVCYCPVETVFMISAYAVSPEATDAEARFAGDAIDSEIEKHAQKAGVSKLLIVVPKGSPGLPLAEFKEVRVFERSIPNNPLMGVGCSAPSQATIWN